MADSPLPLPLAAGQATAGVARRRGVAMNAVRASTERDNGVAGLGSFIPPETITDAPRPIAAIVAIVVGAIAVVVLAGWTLDIAALQSVHSGLAPLKPSSEERRVGKQ